MKNNNLNDCVYIIGILCACLTMIFICMVASAEEYQEIEEGVFQEIIPSNDDIDNSSYEGSTEVYSFEFADGSEGEEKQVNEEEGTTEIEEDGNNNLSGEQDQTIDSSSEQEISLLTSIDDGIKKLIISLWVLFGLGLGTKLVKGLFGYG